MAWNPYTDQKNRAFSSILTTLFPEQTKTLPRILVWSFIFLLDLTLGVVAAFHYGLHDTFLLLAGIIGVFWLQGVIWYSIKKLFKRRKEIG